MKIRKTRPAPIGARFASLMLRYRRQGKQKAYAQHPLEAQVMQMRALLARRRAMEKRAMAKGRTLPPGSAEATRTMLYVLSLTD